MMTRHVMGAYFLAYALMSSWGDVALADPPVIPDMRRAILEGRTTLPSLFIGSATPFWSTTSSEALSRFQQMPPSLLGERNLMRELAVVGDESDVAALTRLLEAMVNNRRPDESPRELLQRYLLGVAADEFEYLRFVRDLIPPKVRVKLNVGTDHCYVGVTVPLP